MEVFLLSFCCLQERARSPHNLGIWAQYQGRGGVSASVGEFRPWPCVWRLGVEECVWEIHDGDGAAG